MAHRKKLLLLVTVVVVLFSSAGTALAYTTYNNHVLNGGVSGRQYYITSSASPYASHITGAVSDWVNTSSRLGIWTPTYWSRTYTQSASVMDIYYGYYYSEGTHIIGFTEHILNNQVISPWLANWNWGKVKLNSPLFYYLSDYNKKGSTAHEIGHLMGLGHTYVTNRVMCQLGDGRTVNACTADDAYGINYLY